MTIQPQNNKLNPREDISEQMNHILFEFHSGDSGWPMLNHFYQDTWIVFLLTRI